MMMRNALVSLYLMLLLLPRLGGAAHLDLTVDLAAQDGRVVATAELAVPADFRFDLDAHLDVIRACVVEADGCTNVQFQRMAERAGNRVSRWRVATPNGGRLRVEFAGVFDQSWSQDDPDAPFIGPRGTYLPFRGDRPWYPRPHGAYSYTLRVSCRNEQRVLSNGKLISETLPANLDGNYSAEFHAAEQPKFGVWLLGGPYIVNEFLIRDEKRTVRLRTYLLPEESEVARSILKRLPSTLAEYEDRIGMFPYDGFSIVSVRRPGAYAIPYVAMVEERTFGDSNWLAHSIAHELLHQWFGIAITQPEREEWVEGLTTFLSNVSIQELHSPALAQFQRMLMLKTLATTPTAESALDNYELSFGLDSTRDLMRKYGKATFFFIMLRDLIGQNSFDGTVKRIWAHHQSRGIASWSDFEAAATAVSGRDLSEFFRQWTKRQRAPRIDLKARTRGVDARTLELVISQEAPPYSFELPLEIVHAQGSERSTVKVSSERERVTMETKFVPELVRIDPDARIWRLIPPREFPSTLGKVRSASAPCLLVVSKDMKQSAKEFAEYFFRYRVTEDTTVERILRKPRPCIIVGLHADVDRVIRRLHLTARPAELGHRGRFELWVVPGAHRMGTLAVASTASVGALREFGGVGAQVSDESYFVVESRTFTRKGTWPLLGIPITTPELPTSD